MPTYAYHFAELPVVVPDYTWSFHEYSIDPGSLLLILSAFWYAGAGVVYNAVYQNN